MAGNKKKTTSPAVKGILIVVIILCIGVMGFSAYKLISTQLEYKKSRDEYASLQDYIAQTGGRDEEIGTGTQTNSATEASSVSEELQKNKCPITVDAQGLLEKNPDFVGWIYMEAVEVSYPVVQGPDNDFYLHRTFEGTYNFSGSIFLDYENRKDMSSTVSIIYGHNMKDMSMFGSLKKLINEGKYADSPYFWIVTPEHEYRYRFISLEHTDAYSTVYSLYNDPSNAAVAYMMDRNTHSHVAYELPELTLDSRIVVLSTCVGADSPERFVVTGLLDMIDGEEIYGEDGSYIYAGEDPQAGGADSNP